MHSVRGEPSDAELIAAWRAGDEAAATTLVKRHAGPVARYLSAAGGGDEVDDLVQETFFRAFRKMGSFRGKASFQTWLIAIGSNVLKDAFRRSSRQRVVALEDRDVVDGKSSPHHVTVERDLMRRLQKAVGSLPEKQRDVFLLRAQQGRDYEEIAAALGTSVGAARVHYHQAVKRLKKVLD